MIFSSREPRTRGSTRRLTELDSAQKELKRQQLTIEEWQQRDGAYRKALADAERLREQIRQDRVEHGRLTRIKSAIPLVARRAAPRSELAKLGDSVRLRDGFGAEFRAAQEKRTPCRACHRQGACCHRGDQGESGPARSAADLCSKRPTEIEALQERLGAFEKASRDRVNIESLQQENEHQARRLLRELGRPTDLGCRPSRYGFEPMSRQSSVGWARSLPSFEARLTRHGGRSRAMTNRSRAGRSSSASWSNRPTSMHSAAQCDRPAKRGTSNHGCLRRAISWSVQQKDGATALAQLTGWHGTADELRHLAVPLGATWINWKPVSWNCRGAGRHLPSRCPRKRNRSASARAVFTPLRSSKTCPARKPFLLLAGEGTRVGGWFKPPGSKVHRVVRISRHFWLSLHRLVRSRRHIRTSVKHADALADRLRREADRVARKAELQAALERHRASCAELEHDSKLLEDRHTVLEEEWKALVAPLGINARRWTPAELRAWLRRREDVVKLLEKVEEASVEGVEPLEQAAASHRAALQQGIRPHYPTGLRPTASIWPNRSSRPKN